MNLLRISPAKQAKARLITVLDMDRSKLGYVRRGPLLMYVGYSKIEVAADETLHIESRGWYRIMYDTPITITE